MNPSREQIVGWLESAAASCERFLRSAVDIWGSGGWAMIGIAIIALVMFGLGLRVFAALRQRRFAKIPERVWRRWIDAPEERSGRIGEILDFVSASKSLKDVSVRFAEVRNTELEGIDRDLRVMKVCVGVSPLMGLLGTVTGMLATFAALSSGSGGEKTMGLVAGGISEALVTTETGLVMAIGGLFFRYLLLRSEERY